MQTIPLADTGRRTTRLGFGCSSIMGATGRRESLRLLESAYDAGIRHFDVAPMYGYGHAESCLGEFLQRHRSEVTVTTKYGIPAARNSTLLRVGRRLAGPILQHLPGMKRRLASAANTIARHNEPRAAFTPAQAAASLERSLAALRADRIDLWLLHEVTAVELQDEALLRFLEDRVQQGFIGSFGVGSTAGEIPSLLDQRPAYCRVLQYEWSVVDSSRPPVPDSRPIQPFRIHHRALTENFRAVRVALLSNETIRQRWSHSIEVDLADADTLARLMLKAALIMNPDSIILFSSKRPEHIRANVETANDSSLEAPARSLYTLAQAEIGQLLPAPA